MSSLGDSPLWTPPAAHVCFGKERRSAAEVCVLILVCAAIRFGNGLHLRIIIPNSAFRIPHYFSVSAPCSTMRFSAICSAIRPCV